MTEDDGITSDEDFDVDGLIHAYTEALADNFRKHKQRNVAVAAAVVTIGLAVAAIGGWLARDYEKEG